MIPNSSPNDPGASGNISFFSLNAGVSIAHTDDRNKWYAGFSARHLNKPQANMNGNPEYHLPVTQGIQGDTREYRVITPMG